MSNRWEETPFAAATLLAFHRRPAPLSCTSRTQNDRNRTGCRLRGSIQLLQACPFSSRAPPLPPQNPETTSGRTPRQEASRSPLRLLSWLPQQPQQRRARPVDFAMAPILPLFHLCKSRAP